MTTGQLAAGVAALGLALPEGAEPKLLAYLSMMCETYRCVSIIRYDSKRAFILIPPTWMHDGEWHEYRDDLVIVSRTAEEQAILDLANQR